MFSDVTVTFADHTVTFSGLYVVIGLLLVVGIAGFLVAWNSARRMERKVSETTDLLVVQLERIGEALERIITQNATRPVAEPAAKQQRAADRSPLEWAGRSFPPRVIPEGSALERAAQKNPPEAPFAPPVKVAPPVPAATQASAEPSAPEKKPEEQPVESTLSEPARSILFSMLGR
jgi:hypothetical protein